MQDWAIIKELWVVKELSALLESKVYAGLPIFYI